MNFSRPLDGRNQEDPASGVRGHQSSINQWAIALLWPQEYATSESSGYVVVLPFLEFCKSQTGEGLGTRKEEFLSDLLHRLGINEDDTDGLVFMKKKMYQRMQ
jgi:hypothetical protein